jgi:hypothetical protein
MGEHEEGLIPVIGERSREAPRKGQQRRKLLFLLLLLIPFALGGLAVELLHGGGGAPTARSQGTPAVLAVNSSTPSASNTQAVGGVEATPIPTPTPTPIASAVGSGGGGAQVGGVNFRITGGVGNLAPGVAMAIRLTLTNPNDVPIYVTSLTVSTAADSTPPGCISASNVQLTQSNASSASPIAVPAGGSVTLTSAPGAPQIMLLNLPGVNQDVCKNKSFALTYSGSARS